MLTKALLRSWARFAGEIGDSLAISMGGGWRIWAESLRRLRRAFADVDRAASETTAIGTTAIPGGFANVRVSRLARGEVGIHLLDDAVLDGGAIFAAHPDIVAQTQRFGRLNMRLNRVEVARHYGVRASDDAIRWTKEADIPWNKLEFKDPMGRKPFLAFFNWTEDGRVLLPAVGRHREPVYTAVHPAIFGRSLGVSFKEVLGEGRSIALLPYPGPPGAASGVTDIMAGLQQAGMPSPITVFAPQPGVGVVPNWAPPGIPGLENQSWLTLVPDFDDVDDILRRPFDTYIVRF